jgi:hypothetical protein
MPSCRKCGSYTKYNGGLCSSCYYGGKKSKAGWVYTAKVGFKSGKETTYVGQTGRSVYKRIGEHMRNQNTGNTKSYVGRGVSVEPTSSFYSNNRFKAERTLKENRRKRWFEFWK